MSILEKIIERKKEEVKGLRNNYSLSDFKDFPFFCRETLSLKEKLESENDLTVIAEVKKASPSKGLIRADFNHREIAKAYTENGAGAISVLTDEKFFQGKAGFLKDIAEVRSVPVLRKDFIIDIFQVYEAKALGADAMLLIAEALSKNEISELTHAAMEAGLEVLLEVHSKEQLDKIDFSLNSLIGINNRNLSDFVTDLKTTLEISEILPEGISVVSESGITSRESVEAVKHTRAQAILVGEHLMRNNNVGEALIELRKWCKR